MNTYYVAGIPYSDSLYHFGIKGQKWGIRRYQNADGTLTAEGKARYGSDAGKAPKKLLKSQVEIISKTPGNRMSKLASKIVKEIDNTEESKKLNEYNELVSELMNNTVKLGGTQVYLSSNFVNEYNRAESAYRQRGKAIVESHLDEMATATLQDLGYDVTDSGKQSAAKLLRKISVG